MTAHARAHADDIIAALTGDGVIALRGAFGADDAARLRDAIWRRVEATSPVRRDDATTWQHDGSFGLGVVERRDVWHAVLANEAVVGALDTIFGRGAWTPPAAGPHVLLTFPTPGPWEMPSGWHVDFGEELPAWPVPAVKLFAMLDTVRPHGGGTMVELGSHRRDGAHVRPVELTGEPGDVFLTHIHVRHSPAPNVGDRVRLMVGAAFRRAAGLVGGAGGATCT